MVSNKYVICFLFKKIFMILYQIIFIIYFQPKEFKLIIGVQNKYVICSLFLLDQFIVHSLNF